jgi:hypothetical protein
VSEDSQTQGFGEYYPESAGYQPYNDAMAAWRNQVRAMQDEGSLPRAQEPAEGPEEPERAPEPEQASQEAQTPPEGVREPDDSQEMDENPERRYAAPESVQGDSGDGEEGDSEQEEPQEVYDPSVHNAPEVVEYLKGVGEQEAVRVLDAERAGKNRKGITSQEEEILARSRENDQDGSDSPS